jgi:hypothetical protein
MGWENQGSGAEGLGVTGRKEGLRKCGACQCLTKLFPVSVLWTEKIQSWKPRGLVSRPGFNAN